MTNGAMLTVDVHLPPGHRRAAMSADAERGLTAVPKSLPPVWFYDRARQRALRRDHATARVLPDAYRAFDPRRARRRDRARRGRRRARRARIGNVREDAAAPRRDGARELICARSFPSTSARRRSATRPPRSRTRTRSPCTRSSATSTITSRRSHEEESGSSRSSGARSATSIRRNVVASSSISTRRSTTTTGCCSAPTWSRTGPGSSRRTTTRPASTAMFNRNVLGVLNRELGAHFDLDTFEHVALWDEHARWVEMRLRSTIDQVVAIDELAMKVRFDTGEEMRTEIAAKFTEEQVQRELWDSGFVVAGDVDRSGRRFHADARAPVLLTITVRRDTRGDVRWCRARSRVPRCVS